MRHFTALLILCYSFGALPAAAWWETGHQTVARIAAAHLTPAARARVAQILDVPNTPRAVANALASASIWADETKRETGTGAWHYINLTLQDRRSDIPIRCPNSNCAPARIRLFAAQLASHTPDAAEWSSLDALRYLVHLVGDIHQPLHTVSDADLGGNCELLPDPIGGASNLHALWDGGILKEMDVTGRSLAGELNAEIATWSPARRASLAAGNQNDWTWESHLLAVQDVYQRLHIPVEPEDFPKGCAEAPEDIRDFDSPIDRLYVADMQPVIRSQLEKGGLRLARLLNEALR